MKRTKTFVMKFLSVLAVGALVLSSCTKDLEDRMDKVEETLAVVVKDIASLKTELSDLKNTQATVTGEKDATGKVTLTFTNPSKTLIFQENKDAAVTVVPDATTGMTTVTVDGQQFVFPTSIPTNVTGIVPVKDLDLEMVEGARVKVNYYFNTNDGKSIDAAISVGNLIVMEGQGTKAESAFKVSELLKVEKVERVGTTNEYEVTFIASTLDATDVANYKAVDFSAKLQLQNAAKTLSTPILFGIRPVATVTDFEYRDNTGTDKVFSATIGSLTAANKNTIVNVIGDEYSAVTTKNQIDINGVGVTADDIDFSSIVVKAYAYDNTKPVPAYYFMNEAADATAKVAAEKLLAEWIALPANGVTEINVAKISEDLEGIEIDATAIAKTITGYNSKTILVVVSGKTVSANGAYLGGAVKYTVTKRLGVKIAEDVVFKTTKTQEVATLPDYTKTVKTTQYYADLTGITSINVTPNLVCTVTNAKGEDVTTGWTISGDALDSQTRLEFAINAPVEAPAGVYTVVYAHQFTNKDNVASVVDIVTKVEIKRPVATPTTGLAVEADSAKRGYVLTSKDIVLNSVKPYNTKGGASAVNGIAQFIDLAGITTTGTGSSLKVTGLVTVKDVDAGAFAAGTNFKVSYRPYITVGGVKTYIDGETDATYAAPKFTNGTFETMFGLNIVAGKPVALVNTILPNTTYNVDAVVVYPSDLTEVVADICTIRYNTVKIDGFMAKSNSTASTTDFNFATPIVFGATDGLNLRYSTDGIQKTFFFANNPLATALWAEDAEAVTLTDAYNKMIQDIEYKVDEITLTAADIAKLTTTAIVDDKVTFITFPSAKLTIGTTEIQSATDAVATVSAANATAVGRTVTGIKAGQTVTQPITVTITDIWGLTTTLKMNVTINPAAI